MQEVDVQSQHGSSAGHTVSRRNSHSHSLSRGNSFIYGVGEKLHTEATMEEAIHILSLQSPDSSTQIFRRVSAKLHSTDNDRVVLHSGKLRERQRTGSGFLRRRTSELDHPGKGFERGLSSSNLLKERQKSNLENILVEGWSPCVPCCMQLTVDFALTCCQITFSIGIYAIISF